MVNRDKVRWEKIQTIFHDIADMPANAREVELQMRCDGDPDLLADVRELLLEDGRDDFILDKGLGAIASSFVSDDHDARLNSMLGEQLGPYRIQRMLGEGGMGVVYLAERTDIGGFVAVKLLRDAWLSPARRRRFAFEQKTLAQLNHPAIARLYDADTLADGTPWFVMEYVEGLPLTQFWRAGKGSIEDCLRLFRRICEAVLYAHMRAIIHRDLKPSNVLVTEDGSVKLLDFGIAKHLHDASENMDATVTGLRAMTPAYAAPEQLNGTSVGVFTDVYSLGILLYELLTGKLPFDRSSIARYSIDLDAARPSSLAKAERFTLPVSKAQWADLNMLCLTAMRPEPSRRYSSVEALIRDIDAFLDNRPLDAQADRWTYRAGKFISRHRAGLLYAAATFLLIAGLIGFFTLRLQRARNAALAQAERTERIQRFTANLFQGGDESAGPGSDLKVATLLQRGTQEVQSLSGDPQMQADMRETLGNIYRRLGDPRKADDLLSAALEERRSAPATDQRKIIDGTISLALARMEEARLGDAETLTRQALDMARHLPASDASTRPTIASAMLALGNVLEAKGDYGEDIKVLEDALKMQPQSGPPTTELAKNLAQLANAHFYSGHFSQAEALEQRALAMDRGLHGENHPQVAEDLNTLGAIQHELGNLHAAELYYRKSLAITEGWYGKEHPNTAQDLTSLGRTLVSEKQYNDARPVLERALHIQLTIHGHDHPAVASALNELGNLATQQDDYAVAEARYAEALQIWRSVYGNNHQFIGVGLSNLGSVYMGQKNFPKAEAMYREAVAVFIATVHEDHLNTAIAHLKLGRALLRQKRYAEAEKETLRAYETLSKLVAPSNNFLLSARKDLEAIYTGLNRKADADRYRTTS